MAISDSDCGARCDSAGVIISWGGWDEDAVSWLFLRTAMTASNSANSSFFDSRVASIFLFSKASDSA